MKKLSFLDKVLYLINSLLAILLLFSYSLQYLSPKSFPVLAVLSLFVPVLIILNLIFLIYWVIKLKKQFLISFIFLTLGLFLSPPIFKISEKSSSLNDDLKVMSYNVKTFDLFNNKNNKDGYDFIAEIDPDILIIQEFYQSSKIRLNFPYKYIKKKNGEYGLAIYSKYKIINSGSLDLKNTSNNIIYCDILKEKDTIRIYNLHLESLRIKPNEENFGEKNSEKLLNRISASFKKQVYQTELFLEHEQNWNGKIIISGDFNNTAYSWVYKQILSNKKDAFISAGKGFGKTYNYFLPTRIDFIITNKNAIINTFKTYSVDYSDHYPIMSKISW
ncbi:MAG: Uncharacterised protein [Polaribacter sp. SA4-10]|nr:MAG: Uncharacterised protein [Polaribacter sp. SA4-10]